MKTLKITRYAPASCWKEGFPLGNGHMGAMYYGGIEADRFDLSENTFFSGAPSENNREGAAEAFAKLRKAERAGDYKSAEEYTEKFMGKRGNYGTNLPVGRLSIEYGTGLKKEEDTGERKPGGPKRYVRTLDYGKGIASVQAAQNREAFVSHPGNALYYRVSAEEGDTLSLKIHFEGGNNPYTVSADGTDYYFSVNAYETLHSDGRSGVTLRGRVTVSAHSAAGERASVIITEEGIQVLNASEVFLLCEMRTNYKELAGRRFGEETFGLPAGSRRYEAERGVHADDVSSYMERMSVSLSDPAFEQLLQFGRYLLLCSSREDSALPAHLQGAWNDNVACRIGWTCDMHLDINTQMNYWLAGPGALSECEEPLFSWMEECLIPEGRKAARANYNLPGWCAELVSNAWGFASPYWAKSLSPYPAGGIWTASAYWEHYLYTEDETFLRERAYPVLKEAVQFFLAYVYEERGRYHCGPSISAENSFLVNKEQYFLSHDCTHEVTLVRELLDQFLTASEILGLTEYTAKAERVWKGLADYRILPDGTLAEYAHDYPAADPQHRHTSHLLGLFPYAQITPEYTPDLAEAAKRSIEAKLTPYESWEDTGWARSMLMLYSARLKDGEGAYRHLKEMQEKLMMPNGMVKHPPTRGANAFDDVYELDGNTGSAVCILEMLLQSHNGVMEFLPALPKAWANGHIEGIRARGGVTVDLYWKEGRLSMVRLTAKKSGSYCMKYRKKRRILYLRENVPLTVVGAMFWS